MLLLWRILYILFCLEVGVFLLFFPWLSLWENNYLLFRFPEFRPILSNAYLKGAILGLGVVNLWIGIAEIGQFRRQSSSQSAPSSR